MNNFTEVYNQHIPLHDVALQSGSLSSTILFNNDEYSYSEAKHISHSVLIRNSSCALLENSAEKNLKTYDSKIKSSLRIYL